MEDLKVSCYSGYTYAERPQSFRWLGVEYNIDKIDKEWLEPDKKCFQVRTCGNKIFRLCYCEADRQWSLAGLAED